MATFTEAFTRLREDFDQGHESRLKLLHDIRAEVQRNAAQLGSQLAEQAKHRHAEFTASLRDLRGTVRRQAEQTRRELADLAADLHQGGATLNRRPGSGEMRTGKRAPRH